MTVTVADPPGSRSQSQRWGPTRKYWSPSDAVLLEDYDSRAGNGTFDNAANIALAIAQAKAAGSSRLGMPIRLRAGDYATSSPVVLPRTGSTPTNVVHLLGDIERTSILRGSADFPANRALVEWEATTTRVWHGTIAGIQFSLPSVAGVKAIHYKLNATTPATATLTQYNNERMGRLTLRNLLIEASNDYHQYLIDLEGAIFYSTIADVFGDPTLGSGTYNTCLLRFSHLLAGADAAPGTDSPGFAYGSIRNVASGLRRGGRQQLVTGRLFHSSWDTGWCDSGSPSANADYDLKNCAASHFTNIGDEGRSTGQVKLYKGWGNVFSLIRLSTPSPTTSAWQAGTAYTVGQRVHSSALTTNRRNFVVTVAGTSGGSEPTWPTTDGATVTDGGVTWQASGYAVGHGIDLEDAHRNSFRDVQSAPGKEAFSKYGVLQITVDSLSSRNLFERVQTPTNNATGTPDAEVNMGLSAQKNYARIESVGGSGVTSGTTYLVGTDPLV